LIEDLKAIRGPKGEEWETKVYTPEEIYPDGKGDYPDLTVYFDDLRWRSAGTIGYDSPYLSENDKGPDDAVHSHYGVFILYDPNKKKGRKIGDINILDVAPTILKVMDIQVPLDMEGKVVKEARQRLKVEDFGDEVRRNLSKGLGFSKEDRNTHNKRIIYVCKLLTRNGISAIVSLISPYRSTRAYAREQLPKFVEVYLKCSLEECKRRDPKGLYKKALAGEITNMTRIQDPYEEPLNPEVTLNTENDSPQQNIRKIMQKLQDLGCLDQ
jgi:adenylylsulfate kinase